jgi:hypothetical protein
MSYVKRLPYRLWLAVEHSVSVCHLPYRQYVSSPATGPCCSITSERCHDSSNKPACMARIMVKTLDTRRSAVCLHPTQVI